jgi:hypothetical protein
MTRSIVFLGNCQAETLAHLYQRVIGADSDSGDDVHFLPSYEVATGEQRRLIADADVLVRQVLDFAPKIGDLETRAVTHLVPHITGAFLWPYTGSPHPRNFPASMLDKSGPYAAELGDSFLNRLILENVAVDVAVERYLDAEVGKLKDLDRLQELVLRKQRDRDRICGYNFANYIEAGFRDQSLFRSPNHPEIPLTMRIASELFGRLGVHAKLLSEMVLNPPDGLFPPSETPIHPGVIEHFNLRFATKFTRFRYFDEGRFTFEEYARRYMCFEWNPSLAEGFHLMRSGLKDEAFDVLQRAIKDSPRSAIGRFILSGLLSERGRLSEAYDMANEAALLEPENVSFRKRLDFIANELRLT